MVRFNVAFVSLALAANASAVSFTSKAKARSEFLATMRAVVKDPKIQANKVRKMKSLTKKIVSKAKSVRGVEEVEYYAGPESTEADEVYYDESNSTEAEEADEVYYDGNATAEEAEVVYYEAEEEAETSSSSYYAKAWGSDDEYDYSALTSFDISKFSLKVHSCKSLSNFDLDEFVEEAEQEYERENAQGQQQNNEVSEEQLEGIVYPYTGIPMVNFRLCPTDSCQDDTWQGCRNVYGNYMIPLEDYMEATSEHLEEEVEEYCDYCKQCMYFYKYFNAQCEYYSECESYANVCAQNNENYYQNEEKEEINYEDYLECTAVEKTYYQQYYNKTQYYEEQQVAYQNGYNRRAEQAEDDKVYLKIFCDGSIKIGIFSDDECTNYIGETTTIYEATGLELVEDDLQADYMDNKCVSCAKTNNQFYVIDQDQAEEKENKDDDAAEEEEEIYEICENLYEEAAKCNAFLPYSSYYEYDEEDGEWEQTMNPIVCGFMEAVQKGKIDKYGYVHLSRNHWYGKYVNKVNNDFLPEGYYLTDGQFIGIVGGLVVCLALMIYGIAFKPYQESVETKELKANLV